jgi:hypothetical protein
MDARLSEDCCLIHTGQYTPVDSKIGIQEYEVMTKEFDQEKAKKFLADRESRRGHRTKKRGKSF